MSTKIKEYSPVFCYSIVIEKQTAIDLNYFGIKQILKNKFNLDFFRRVKENKKYQDVEIKYKEFFMKVWEEYCNWFNGVFNNGEKKTD